jgi:hypothetical protein
MGVVSVRVIGSKEDIIKFLRRMGYTKRVKFYNCKYNEKMKRVYIKIRV